MGGRESFGGRERGLVARRKVWWEGRLDESIRRREASVYLCQNEPASCVSNRTDHLRKLRIKPWADLHHHLPFAAALWPRDEVE